MARQGTRRKVRSQMLHRCFLRYRGTEVPKVSFAGRTIHPLNTVCVLHAGISELTVLSDLGTAVLAWQLT